MIVVASADKSFYDRCKTLLETNYAFYEGLVHDKHALLTLLKKPQPLIGVLILDLTIMGNEGINEITELLELRPGMHIIIFVEAVIQREEISAILFGAKAYCAKSDDLSQLSKIIRAVMHNEVWVDRLFVTRLLAEIRDISDAKLHEAQHLDHGIKDLTPRENEIADKVANGATNRTIARDLAITERTVKAHLGSIFKKMHVKDRLQLAISLNRHHQIPGIWHGMVETDAARKQHAKDHKDHKD